MIPKRIKLSGFLCYKDEQEISFDGSALWMLSGLNGSGKSSVFDAVTYALFGHHRGGSQGAVELINKNENSFSIEFEFELDGRLYLIRRTLKRRGSSNPGTQQVFCANGDGRFEAVADTHRKTEFDAWIRDHIGLNFETFTSSVLLLQGRAEKLLDSTAKGRAEVLAGIVDLVRYQKLHEKADSKRKALRGQVETLQSQYEALPEVTELELLAAANRIEDAAEGLKQAQAEVDRLQTLEFHSKQWAERQAKLAAARSRRQSAAKLLHEAAAIEHDLARLKELRDVLPHVETIVQRRADLSQCDDATKVHAGVIRDLESQLADAEHQLEQGKRKKATHQKQIAGDEQKLHEIARRLPQLSAQVERLQLVETRREEVAKLEGELAKFPADLTQQVADAQREIEELTLLQQALPHLARLVELREDLKSTRQRLTKAQEHEAQIKSNGESIRAELDQSKPKFEAARAALKSAEDQIASEKALLRQATDLLAEFDQLNGAKTCRACGQALTPAHFRQEKARRQKDRSDLEARVKAIEAELKSAQESHKLLGDHVQGIERQLEAARDEYKDARNQVQQALKDVGRLNQECEREYNSLPELYRVRVAAAPPADWSTTEFPTSPKVDDMRRKLTGLPIARRQLEHAREAITRHRSLEIQTKAARQSLADLSATLSGDANEVRREFARLDAENKSLVEQLRATRQEERAAQTEIDRFTDAISTLRESLADRHGKLQTEEARRKLCEQAIAGARKTLPADWQTRADGVALAEMNRLRGERDELEHRGVEKRATELKQARIDAESLNQALADLERELEQTPPDARRNPEEVAALLKQSRAAYAAKADALNAARNDRGNLELRIKQRDEIRTQLNAAELELNRYKLLSELLGRDRLQRHLVRQAERQIVDCANGVLDRLSGGQLMMRLVGNDDGTAADEALELECWNRATGQSPINVAFLSGSQRFRVAVSLALGIGQYASRQHRPIESVIIDEGFGCLDRNGRQVMIQELQNLRGHLQCILLVSHQDEFAEAFADGYRFELTNGATRVSRFQR